MSSMAYVDLFLIAYLIYENYKLEKEIEHWKNRYYLETFR